MHELQHFIVMNKTDIDGMLFAEPTNTRVWERSPNETAVKYRLVAFSDSSTQRKSADHRRNYNSTNTTFTHGFMSNSQKIVFIRNLNIHHREV